MDLTKSGVLITKPSKTFEKDPSKDLVAVFDLVIDKDQLESNAEYKLRLTVEGSNSSSYSEVSFVTNGPPSKGMW